MLTAPEHLELREVDEPVAPPGEATIRIHVVGVCGTDQSIFSGKIPVAYPRIIGHEMIGRVLEPGGGGAESGARVIVDPNVACGTCDRCREGRANLCSRGWLLGRDRDGALREIVTAPTANLHRLPDDLADHVGPVIQVLTTCLHAQRRMPVFPGEAVVVVGLGVTGLLHVQLAKLRGANPVVGVSRSVQKLRLAEELGADATVPAEDPAVLDRVMEASGGGADVTIECAGTVATLALAVRAARPGGRVLAYGTIGQTEGSFPYYELYYKELDVRAARAAQREDYAVAIDVVRSGRVALEPLVSRRIPLGSLPEALASGVSGGLKTVVEMSTV